MDESLKRPGLFRRGQFCLLFPKLPRAAAQEDLLRTLRAGVRLQLPEELLASGLVAVALLKNSALASEGRCTLPRTAAASGLPVAGW